MLLALEILKTLIVDAFANENEATLLFLHFVILEGGDGSKSFF